MLSFFFLIAGSVFFKLFKLTKSVSNLLEKGVPAKDYFQSKISIWNKTKGNVKAAKIKFIPPFTSRPSCGRYYLEADVTYEYNGITLHCSASPYSLFPTEQKAQAERLLSMLLKDRTVDIYIDPTETENPFFLCNNALTWKELPY